MIRLWCAHSIGLDDACGGVSMPLLLGLENPARSDVDGIFQVG